MRGCRSRTSVFGSTSVRNAARGRSRVALRVESALTRQRKEEIVETVKERLKGSALVFGMSTRGLNVQQMEELRQSLPSDHSSMYVCKHTLMKLAIEQTDGWSGLRSIAKNENAWVFVDEDGIASTVKTWLNFQRVQTKIKRDNAEKEEHVDDVTTLTGGALQGKQCTVEELLKFKDLPTRTEALSSLAGMLNSIPMTLMSTLNQAPMQLAFSVDKIAELDEEKSRLVSEFVKSADT